MPKPVVETGNENVPDWFVGLINVVALCLAFAVLFIYVELLLAAQSPFWTGNSLQDWYETAQALGIYATLLTVAALVPYCVIAPFLMMSTLRHGLSIVLPFLAALGLWFYIDSVIEAIERPLQIGVPGALAATIITVALLGGLRVAKPATTAILILIAVAGAIATLYCSANELLLDSDRVARIATASLSWFAISTVGLLAICIATAKAWPRWLVQIVSGLVLCGVYPAFIFIQPYLDRVTETDERKNVLLITADTLRADFCSAYGGSVPTPNLEALAAEGVLFNNHYALAPWTVPSINALMTSKYPPGLSPNAPDDQHTLEERSYQQLAGYWLDRDGITFTKRLSNIGYNTAVVFGNPTIEFQEWLTHGFDAKKLVDSAREREPLRFRQTPLVREVLGTYRPEFLEDRALDSSAIITQFGQAYLRQHQAAPFFLWLHFMDPHTPYDPPDRFRTRETPWPFFPPDSPDVGADFEFTLTTDEKQAAKSMYEAEIQYVDDCVGQLVFELRRLGLEDDTLICFSSDHGEELWEHGKWGHGHDLYDEQVRVPLIIAGAQVMPNEVDVPVSAINLLPTIADMLGLGGNSEWRGSSMKPLLSGGDPNEFRRPVFTQGTHQLRYDPEPTQMVVDRSLKLIVGLETGTRRLYDLSADPHEEVNLADSMPEDVERLLDVLETWSSGFPSSFNEVDGWRGGQGELQVQPDFDEALKSLGYIQ